MKNYKNRPTFKKIYEADIDLKGVRVEGYRSKTSVCCEI